jgi:hypothetical protein
MRDISKRLAALERPQEPARRGITPERALRILNAMQRHGRDDDTERLADTLGIDISRLFSRAEQANGK